MCVNVCVFVSQDEHGSLEHHNVAIYWRNVVSGGISVVSISLSIVWLSNVSG